MSHQPWSSLYILAFPFLEYSFPALWMAVSFLVFKYDLRENTSITIIYFSVLLWHSLLYDYCCCCSVTPCLTLWLHGLQHARLPCSSLLLGVWPNSCSLSQWCHPIISSSVVPPAFSSSSWSFLASGSFPVSRLFALGGQTLGASASVLSMNIQGWYPLGLPGLISLHSKGLSRIFSAPQFEGINSLGLNLLYGSTLTSIHDYYKNHSFDYMDLCC